GREAAFASVTAPSRKPRQADIPKNDFPECNILLPPQRGIRIFSCPFGGSTYPETTHKGPVSPPVCHCYRTPCVSHGSELASQYDKSCASEAKKTTRASATRPPQQRRRSLDPRRSSHARPIGAGTVRLHREGYQPVYYLAGAGAARRGQTQ